MNKNSFHKLAKTLGIACALGALIYVAYRNSMPAEDPWAAAYWEDAKPAKAE